MGKPGTSESLMLHLAKIQAQTLGAEDEVKQKDKRPKSYFKKRYPDQWEEVLQAYCAGYEARRKFRDEAESKK